MYRLSQTNCAAGPPTGVGRPRSVSPAALRFTWRAAGAKRASTAGSCTGCQSVSRAPPTRRTVSQLAARHVADERSVPESAVPAPACSDAVDAAVDNYYARVVPRRAEHRARASVAKGCHAVPAARSSPVGATWTVAGAASRAS